MEEPGRLAQEPRRLDLVRHDRPGVIGLEAVVGSAGGKRTLVMRDAQHEYTFVEN